MDEPSRGLRRAFVALQYRDFRLLFISQVVTGIGGDFLNFSNAWQIYAMTGSALALGLTGVARAVPVILFSLVGGVIADRFDRRKIIIVSEVAAGALALALSFLTLFAFIQVWHIYLAVFLNNTLSAAATPARRAVVATIVPRHHLMNAMSLTTFASQTERIGAPALAGLLVALVGTPLTYALEGLAQLINAATLLRVSANLAPARRQGSPVRDLIEGLAFVRVHSIILVMMLMDTAANLVGNYVVVLPLLADHFEVGAVGFGLFGSASAVGRVVGSTTLLSLGNFRYKGLLIGGAFLGYAVFLALLGLAPWFALALIAVGGLGMCDTVQAQTRNVLIQLLTPDDLRGRVSSFQSMLQQGGPALGQGVLGAGAMIIGVPMVLVGGAIICGTINLGILLGRKDLRSPYLGAERASTETAGAAR